MTMALPTSERQPEGEDEERRPDEREHAEPHRPAGDGLEDGEAALARAHRRCAARPVPQHLRRLAGEAEAEREEAERAAMAERDAVGDARAEAATIGGQRRIAVGIVGLVHRVRVVGLVVPRDPQPRREREGQEAEPADQLAQAAAAHDGAVQRLVADEGGTGEAVADDEGDERRRPPAADAEVEGGDAAGDDGVVKGEPGEARRHRIECVRGQRRAYFTDVG